MLEFWIEPRSSRLEEKMDLSDGVKNIVQSNASKKLMKGLVLQTAWESIAPKKALEHTDNVVVSKKKANSIAVFVDSPAAAADLSMSKEYYRQMMEHETGLKIDDIFFVVSKKTGIKKSFEKQQEEKPWYIDDCESIPLDEGELEYARMSVEGIKDENLRESLFKALVTDMEWKKGLRAKNKR